MKTYIEEIASLERENGTLAGITESEYRSFCRIMAKAAITNNARAEVERNLVLTEKVRHLEEQLELANARIEGLKAELEWKNV